MNIEYEHFSNAFPPISDFKNIWFLYNDATHWNILYNNEVIGEIGVAGNFVLNDANTSIFSSIISDIPHVWNLYKQRPEFCVGVPINMNGKLFSEVRQKYKDLFVGIMLCRIYEADPSSVDSNFSYMDKVLHWLDSTDFYTCPASTRYHESFQHGLLYHTISVYNNMLELIQIPKFHNCKIHRAALCCLVHDWCKIGLYESYKRNVKNDVTGQWEQVDSYRIKESSHPFGHGVQSMYMAMKLFKLSEEEALAIRWHMGRWHVDEAYVNDFQFANETYPLVHLLQFSDQLAITQY